ncbi:TPA: putative holin [Enterobacter ludwigii]
MSAEPITATVTAGVAAGTTGVTFATLFPEATPAVMVCSLAGAALYILSSEDHKIWKQILFALISFIGGIYCAGTASEIIAALINAGLNQLSPPVTIKVSPAIGALAASTVSVTILLRILARSKSGNLPGVKGEE